ncbi:kinase-like protein [Byssothecium circinans]|uniref:Serine/threonine-protein kinase n=1 Tax=Byssothecium circinans TaxID=147558 RepID=A0A6A5U243_9PLEO|nr:kinase-like protein [Byssothecium circinans]
MPTHADPPPPVVHDPSALEYHTEKQLGRGGFAICWQAQQTDSGRTISKTVALKIVKSRIESRKVAQKFVTELQLHSKLHHPNIVEFKRAFSFLSSTYVVLEICPNGSIANCLKKRSYLSMPEIRRYIIQTCGAVKYLHMRNIVHRDLKAGNLFLDHEMNVKVGDFGLAAVLVGPDDAVMRRTTMCGTPNYLAPEVLEKSGKGHNEKVDIWAIGIIAYTLAVGKAPFHASKPDEVIVKVQKGEYAWPDLGKHKNDIPDDLRQLVSQILVDENSRPSLDTIVSHNFFKLGYLPESLSSNATTSMPKWSVKPPNPGAIKRGYTETWYKQCKASGVGEYAPGNFFSAAGNHASGSIYRECEREAEARKMPIVPMPHGTVYTPFIYKKGKGSTGGLESDKDRELSAISSHLMESNINTKRNMTGPVEKSPNKREGADFQETVPPMASRARLPTSSYAEATRIARRPTVPHSKAVLRATARPVAMKSEAEPKPARIGQRPIRPTRTRSTRIASENTHRTITQAEDGTSGPVQSARPTARTVTAAEAAQVSTHAICEEPVCQVDEELPKPVLPHPPSSRVAAPQDSSIGLYSDPATILARAEELRNNVLAALSSSRNDSSALRNWHPPTDRLPFVSNWVDYSKKHGIGYILADDSIGIVINHTDEKPLTHTIVNHGYKYLKSTSDNPTQTTVPFLFFTQADDGGLEKVTMAEADRKRNSILWGKFGRYMCKNLDEQAPTRARQQEELPITIVRYYQRVGNVSVWGFSNGCFQFNFPDHTKLVLSADGKYISFTALPLPAITHLGTHHADLPPEFIKARKVLSGTIYQLLYGNHYTLNPTSESTSADTNMNIMTLTSENKLPAKLRFVTEVVANWVSGGGLGCKPARRSWPIWGGKALENAWGSKIGSVTVGRFGGDRAQALDS